MDWKVLNNGLEGSPHWTGGVSTLDWRVFHKDLGHCILHLQIDLEVSPNWPGSFSKLTWKILQLDLEVSPNWPGSFSKLTLKFLQIDLEPLSNQRSTRISLKMDSNPPYVVYPGSLAGVNLASFWTHLWCQFWGQFWGRVIIF